MLEFLKSITWEAILPVAMSAFGVVLVLGLFFGLLAAMFEQVEKSAGRSRDALNALRRAFRRHRQAGEPAEVTPEQDFFEALRTGIDAETIENLDDAENIYRGTRGLRVDSSRVKDSLAESLQRYLTQLHSGANHESVANHSDHATRVKALIASCQESAPYDGLPGKEKNIITDMMTFLKAGDAEAALRKLPELTSAIEARESTFARIEKINRYSMPIAFASALSALAGIGAAFYSIAG